MASQRGVILVFEKDQSEYSPAACEFWQANRIPRSDLRSPARFLRWFGTDSEANYYECGDHEFTVDSIGYEFNTLGYRGPEFVREPGEAVALFVGDSNTFGVGMPWEQVWTSIVTRHLEQRWGVPVRQCNLAWPGTGTDYAAMMIHQSIDVIKPDAVFVLWPATARLTWFPDPRRQVLFRAVAAEEHHPDESPAPKDKEHAAYLRLATPSHGFFNYIRNFHLVNSRLLQMEIPYYWGNVENLSTEILHHYVPLDGYVGRWTRVNADFARDHQHAGVKSHAGFAASVTEALERDSVRRVAAAPGSESLAVSSSQPIGPGRRTRSGNIPFLARPIQNALTELKFRHRVRAMKRKDPFIY
jgi:hypothetical protein